MPFFFSSWQKCTSLQFFSPFVKSKKNLWPRFSQGHNKSLDNMLTRQAKRGFAEACAMDVSLKTLATTSQENSPRPSANDEILNRWMVIDPIFPASLGHPSFWSCLLDAVMLAGFLLILNKVHSISVYTISNKWGTYFQVQELSSINGNAGSNEGWHFCSLLQIQT